jgi:hypothetical protein
MYIALYIGISESQVSIGNHQPTHKSKHNSNNNNNNNALVLYNIHTFCRSFPLTRPSNLSHEYFLNSQNSSIKSIIFTI